MGSHYHSMGLAVMLGVFISGPYSGAHLNPALTVGLAVAGSFQWNTVLPYIIAQMLGGALGSLLVYIFYKDHFDATDDVRTKLSAFCTSPAIMDKPRNFFCEFLGTFILTFIIIALSAPCNTPETGMGAVGAFPVTMLIVQSACRSEERPDTRSIRQGICPQEPYSPFLFLTGKVMLNGDTVGFL